MRLIARLLRLVTSRAASTPARVLVAVGELGMVVRDGNGARSLGWLDVERVVASRLDPVAAGVAALVFGFRGGAGLTVDRSHPLWCAVIRGVGARLPRAMPAASWQLQLMAEPASRVVVFHRR